MRFVLALTLLLLAGCAGVMSSTQFSTHGGNGDLDLNIDCAGKVDLAFETRATDGRVLFTILDGAGEQVTSYDLTGDALDDFTVNLSGAAGEWRLGGSFEGVNGFMKIRMAC